MKTLIPVLLVAASLCACTKEPREVLSSFPVIQCRQANHDTFSRALAEEAGKGQLQKPGAKPVQILSNLPPDETIVVSVYSTRLGDTPIYHGPLSERMAVFPPEDIFDEQGMDNFHFRFFDSKNLLLCVQMQDGGGVYWEPGKAINIEFLKAPRTDPDIGRPFGHRVSLASAEGAVNRKIYETEKISTFAHSMAKTSTPADRCI